MSALVVGLAKAPVFAAFIALIACRMGLAVARDARSVGEQHHLHRGAEHRLGDRARRRVRGRAAAPGDLNGDACSRCDDIVTRFGADVVHDGVSFAVAARRGGRADRRQRHRQVGAAEGDHRPAAADRGQRAAARHRRLAQRATEQLNALRRRFGMLFQDGALFSSLTRRREHRRAVARAHRPARRR